MNESIAISLAKLERTEKHIDTLRDEVMGYLADEPSEIITEPDGTIKLKFITDCPPIIPILAGEIIYHIRSVLDHLAFALVSANITGMRLPEGWERRCQFPIHATLPKGYAVPPVPIKRFHEYLPGISIKAYTFLEGLQPYYTRGNGNQTLGWVAKLSDIDKHRHVNLVEGQTRQRMIQILLPLDPSAQVTNPLYRRMKMQGGFHPFVAFDESALGSGPNKIPIADVMQSCHDLVKTRIIPAFDEFLQNL